MSREPACSYLVLTPSEDLAIELHKLLGGSTFWIPVMGFREVEGWRDSLLRALRRCPILGITSPRGAELLARAPEVLEAAERVYAVGPQTARVLVEMAGVKPVVPSSGYSVSSMLREAEAAGERCIVLARSKAGLGKGVEGVGLRVLEEAVYEPVIRREMLEEAARLKVDVAVLTSGEIARMYCRALEKGGGGAGGYVAIGVSTALAASSCPPRPLCVPSSARRAELARAALALCRLLKSG
ncbi:putative uroporphyrinogen-III synthase [Aeropyrum pernix]|uniref:Putative uroporphyrinogen-III synthase n=1 Tax=Aeropyrum pernix TaxID=56636 RepID=A0A401HBP1_AERPX|nr:uroporphyrinogen-III synthase [Aeropyrum pernix]GBF09739.1 putative uroporphyrinogen-III synthase [Aeropyrum pernix]